MLSAVDISRSCTRLLMLKFIMLMLLVVSSSTSSMMSSTVTSSGISAFVSGLGSLGREDICDYQLAVKSIHDLKVVSLYLDQVSL